MCSAHPDWFCPLVMFWVSYFMKLVGTEFNAELSQWPQTVCTVFPCLWMHIRLTCSVGTFTYHYLEICACRLMGLRILDLIILSRESWCGSNLFWLFTVVQVGRPNVSLKANCRRGKGQLGSFAIYQISNLSRQPKNFETGIDLSMSR